MSIAKRVLSGRMNETMLERLARILHDLTRAKGAPSWGTEDPLADARKVLEALRDPTENMAVAGGEAVPGDVTAIHAEVAKDVWRAMIEDALSNDDG